MKQRKSGLIVGLLSLLMITACQSPPTPLLSGLPQNQVQAYSDASSDQLFSARTGFEQYQVVHQIQGKMWPKMELLRTQGLPQEPMQDRGRQQDPDTVACFGTALPASTDVCLHDAGEPTQRSSNIPVLLIHGANMNATSNWATPPLTDEKTGLMQHLRGQGYRVFAVSFANKHGDNFVWVNQIHNAINRIREITGSDQVDTVAHSKGGFALRMYTSDILGPGMSQPYQKHIRKALFIGTPHRGIDYTFRNSMVHWALIPETDDALKYAPVAWTKALIYGRWVDSKASSFLGPYFKGQAQMTARWDQQYPIIPSNPDWYTTYNGGQGLVSQSPGIDTVIKTSGSIVERLKRSPVNADIQVGILAGNRPTIPGVLNELSGPSDGIAFVESTAAAKDLTSGGARLLDQSILTMNHLELVAKPEALNWVDQQLKK